MDYNKEFFEKVFSEDRMKKYFSLYPHDESMAIKHYQCNIMLSEAMYPCLSVFDFVKKANRQRKVIASFLNKFRRLRNRIDHNEAICWNLDAVEEIHEEMKNVMGWMNKDVPFWLSEFDRFDSVCQVIRQALSWK